GYAVDQFDATRPLGRFQLSGRVAAIFAVVVLFVGLAVRQHLFVDKYAVNVFFWDQWDFYIPVFHGQGWWEIFDYQYGNHRLGIGVLISSWLAPLGGWDAR